MDHPMNSLIDQMIQEAERKGQFANLPGAGKPLPEAGDPKDALLHRMMTESRVKPPVVVLQEQIAESRARLKALGGEAERKAEMKVLADLQTRLALETEALQKYG